MSNMTPAEVLAVLERMRVQASIGRCHDNAMSSAELIRQIDEDRAATTAVAALIAECDGYKAGWWDVVEMLGGKKLANISNAQYHASVLVPKLRELIAERDDAIRARDIGRAMASDLIARVEELEAASIGRDLGEVHALIAENSALKSERDALLVAAECYRAISATPMAYDVLKRHGLTAGESPYNFCNRMHDEALARAEAGHG